MRRVFKLNGPACFFEKVKGTKFPVFTGAMFGHKKYSLMVDAPPNIRDIPRTQTSKIGIDATKFYRGHDFPPLVLDSEERLRQITRGWKEYGFKQGLRSAQI